METGFTEIPIGCPVYTIDGDDLGVVKEYKPGFLKVDVPMQPDYWLCQQDISSVAGDRVVMTFGKDHLDEFKVADPDKHQHARRAA
jgi:hypothetical protein